MNKPASSAATSRFVANPVSSSGAAGAARPLPASVDSAPISGAVPVDELVQALRAEIVDLKDKLRAAGAEIGRMRAAEAAGRPPLVALPPEALRPAALPLRFSSIPAPLRRGGRKKALTIGVTIAIFLFVGGLVALSVLSRSHLI